MELTSPQSSKRISRALLPPFCKPGGKKSTIQIAQLVYRIFYLCTTSFFTFFYFFLFLHTTQVAWSLQQLHFYSTLTNTKLGNEISCNFRGADSSSLEVLSFRKCTLAYRSPAPFFESWHASTFLILLHDIFSLILSSPHLHFHFLLFWHILILHIFLLSAASSVVASDLLNMAFPPILLFWIYHNSTKVFQSQNHIFSCLSASLSVWCPPLSVCSSGRQAGRSKKKYYKSGRQQVAGTDSRDKEETFDPLYQSPGSRKWSSGAFSEWRRRDIILFNTEKEQYRGLRRNPETSNRRLRSYYKLRLPKQEIFDS